jgi:hypothetical protein
LLDSFFSSFSLLGPCPMPCNGKENNTTNLLGLNVWYYITNKWYFEQDNCNIPFLARSIFIRLHSSYFYFYGNGKITSVLAKNLVTWWLFTRRKQYKTRNHRALPRPVLGHLAMHESTKRPIELLRAFQLLAQHDLKLSFCKQPARQIMLFWVRKTTRYSTLPAKLWTIGLSQVDEPSQRQETQCKDKSKALQQIK